MALTTDREGMRKALDAMRIGRDPRIAAADFILDAMQEELRTYRGEPDWREYGVRPGDGVYWCMDAMTAQLSVRITLREEAPSFVDLMAA